MSIQLSAIVAMTEERVIGRMGKMPWHLPADLTYFKKVTSEHPVVMGRKTYESIGRPLPKRRNIVLTRDPHWSAKAVEVIHQPADLAKLPNISGRVFIIGGAEIYTAFFPDLEELLISHVHEKHPGDTFFPEFQQLFPFSELIEAHSDFEARRHLRAKQEIH